MRARPSTMREPQLASLPESPLVLPECRCVVGTTRRPNIVEIEVADRDRRDDTATGLTWGEAPLPLVPSRRLVTFVWNAARESLRVLHCVRSPPARPPR